jgi:Kef-type K+ transport system membrane component KefB
VHALFGAFVAGVIMPRERDVAATVAARVEGPVTTWLVPLFFAFTGLRTSIALVTDGGHVATLLAVLACAVVAKVGAASVAARLAGTPWREALAIGALMNTRGLMELVILNIGLDAGVISPTLFAIMVVMALATTLMTSPLLALAGTTSRRVALP